MNFETWLAFVVASMILTMTPGPSIILGVVHSMNYGAKNTIFTALGDISANFIQMILVAIGLGVVIASSDLAFQLIKWFGIVVLIYMGGKMLLSKTKVLDLSKLSNTISRRNLFINGFLVAAGNPKAIIFFTAFFPQFIDADKPLFNQLIIMCPTMAALDFIWVMLYAISAQRFLSFMKTRPRLLSNIGGSALLGASALLASTNQT
ncbi:MAG: LysE family translocator [Cocleimonas sp.]